MRIRYYFFGCHRESYPTQTPHLRCRVAVVRATVRTHEGLAVAADVHVVTCQLCRVADGTQVRRVVVPFAVVPRETGRLEILLELPAS